MRFENAFDVAAPIERVWSTLLDVERVAPCMPGAEVLERTGEDSYRVAIKVRVGPIAMTYRGDVEIAGRDAVAHTATMRARAREARGQGSADANVQMSLAPAQGGGTHTALETEVALSGRVAAMGQGVIGDVAAKLIETFAENLAAMLAAEGGRATATAVSEGASEGATDAPTVAVAPAARPAAQSTLPVARIAAGVIAGRLANPRTLAIVAIGYAIAFAALGFLIGRVV